MTKLKTLVTVFFLSAIFIAKADNPLITHIYTADPTARVFNNKLYIYPSHDIKEYGGFKGHNNFMMEDYHVFSTTDLMSYTDHGVILHQNQISWIEKNSFEMWAPDCHTKNGKYYFYFPAQAQVGVAIADTPEGPFKPVDGPIKNAKGIDPNCFIDTDGTPYLFFGHAEYLKAMRLKDNMIEGDMKPIKIQGLPKHYKEGSFVFKRKDLYYLTFPMAKKGFKEDIVYAISKNPLGPYEYKGIIMDQWKDCWTNHHSIVDYKGQWYMFYHYKDISKDGTLRSIRAEKLFFNEDGTIQKVIPTKRGIGVPKATAKIQVDRYLEASEGLKTPVYKTKNDAGFYVSNIKNNDWLKYTDVDFGCAKYTNIKAQVASFKTGGTIEVRLASKEGKLLGTVPVPKTGGRTKWKTVDFAINAKIKKVQDVVLVFKGEGDSNLFFVDWIQFETEKETVAEANTTTQKSITETCLAYLSTTYQSLLSTFGFSSQNT